MAIRSWGNKRTGQFASGKRVPEFESIRKQAAKALIKLDDARRLADLAGLPGNRLEALGGDRKGQYSIRINDRWRLCFRWVVSVAETESEDRLLQEGEPYDVEIVDYH